MEIKIHSTPGRGKKQCPECKVYLGVRNGKCICGHEFVPVQKKVLPKKEAPEGQESKPAFDRKDFFTVKISIPAGKCPANLMSTDYEAVEEWVGKVKLRGEAVNVIYAARALRYWARQFYDIFSEEYKLVSQHVNEIFGDDDR